MNMLNKIKSNSSSSSRIRGYLFPDQTYHRAVISICSLLFFCSSWTVVFLFKSDGVSWESNISWKSTVDILICLHFGKLFDILSHRALCAKLICRKGILYECKLKNLSITHLSFSIYRYWTGDSGTLKHPVIFQWNYVMSTNVIQSWAIASQLRPKLATSSIGARTR